MNGIQEKKYYYQIKKIKKNSDNFNLKLPKDDKINKHIIIQRKKRNLLIPISLQNERKNTPFLKPLNKNISSNILNKQDEKLQLDNNIYQNLVNSHNMIEERILLEKPKIKIKMNSLNNNNINKNTVSSEKNNNQIICKIHKLKPQTTKNFNGKIINLSKSIIKNNRVNKINYGIIDLNKNDSDSNKMKIELENKIKSYIDYYNIMQEKTLNNLSNHLDFLIGKKTQSKSEHPYANRDNDGINNYNIMEKVKSEKELNMNDDTKKNICNTNIYRKKIQRKKNCGTNTNTFSDTNFLTFEFKNSINSDKSDILNINCNNGINNKLRPNRTFKYISNINNNSNYNEEEQFSESTNNYKTNSILTTTYGYRNKYNPYNSRNYLSELRPKKEYLNLDNIEDKNLIFNNIHRKKFKDNKIDYIEIIKSDIKDENYSSKRINYINNTYKRSFYLDTPKNSNLITNTTNLDTNSKYEKNFYLNNFFGSNDNNDNYNVNMNNNFITVYSNHSSQYNTVNTLNNSEKNILKKKKPQYKKINKDNTKFNRFTIMKNKNNNLFIKRNNLTSKKIFIRNDVLKKRTITSNNSNNKKLRNVVTSIDYSNRSNKIPNCDLIDKNIILSEIDQNGKVNIRVREMKNSIEKILRENSFTKRSDFNLNRLPSPQKWSLLTYVKKNQGTHLKKVKGHNSTVNHIRYYPPPLPLQ